ncbi:hypothetical protein [Actinoplanes sp. G11-F43]|uniref:hypothetical protein n=1 Tax=Actinoplanes sp. G11-F43 TaxID=3424130 RepID=UPI003D3598E1
MTTWRKLMCRLGRHETVLLHITDGWRHQNCRHCRRDLCRPADTHVAPQAPPARERSAARTHPPASERSIRDHLREFPNWMIEECLLWTREREGRGWQFTSGAAAARHWLDDAQRPTRLPTPPTAVTGS